MGKKDRKNEMHENSSAEGSAEETTETAAVTEQPVESAPPAAEQSQEAPEERKDTVEAMVAKAEAESAAKQSDGEAEEPGEEQYTTLCALTGQLAGKITEQIHTLKAKLDRCCIQLGRLAYRSAHGRDAASPEKSPAEGSQSAAERKQALLAELGAEVARLQHEQVQDVMSQPSVHELIGKIRACEESSDAAAPEEPAAEPQA